MTTLLPYRPERDVYRLLGLHPYASRDEIVAACRRLSRAFHPDRNRSPRANQEMQVVNVVRRVMTDPNLRAEYDVARRQWYAAALAPPPRPLAPSAAAARATNGSRPRPRSLPPPLATGTRYAWAAWIGFMAALEELAPPRCGRCRMVIASEDAYCVSCGVRLLT